MPYSSSTGPVPLSPSLLPTLTLSHSPTLPLLSHCAKSCTAITISDHGTNDLTSGYCCRYVPMKETPNGYTGNLVPLETLTTSSPHPVPPVPNMRVHTEVSDGYTLFATMCLCPTTSRSASLSASHPSWEKSSVLQRYCLNCLHICLDKPRTPPMDCNYIHDPVTL